MVTLATIKVFDCNGVKSLQCFDTLDNIPYDEEEVDEIVDDGELTVGTPIE